MAGWWQMADTDCVRICPRVLEAKGCPEIGVLNKPFPPCIYLISHDHDLNWTSILIDLDINKIIILNPGMLRLYLQHALGKNFSK